MSNASGNGTDKASASRTHALSRKFECTHKGHCCENKVAPVNLTVGDLLRLSTHTGTSVRELFSSAWHAVPFGQENTTTYTIEPGLELPCMFRKNGRCSVHPARPLNCRLFPYWILARLSEVSREKHFEPEDLCCAYNCHPTAALRKAYQRYVDALYKILHKESLLTTEIIAKLKLTETVELPKDSTSFFNEFLAASFRGPRLERMKAEHHLMVARTLIKQEEFLALADYIDAHREDLLPQVATAEEITALEHLLKSQSHNPTAGSAHQS